MKHNYLFLTLLLCLFSVPAFAQIVANNDSVGYASGTVDCSVLANDTYNGNPITNLSSMGLSCQMVSTSQAGITLSANGNISLVGVPSNNGNPPTPYTMTYKIFETAHPTVFDTATVSIFVCSAPQPTYTETYSSNCATPAQITITNNPGGNWTLVAVPDNGEPSIEFPGNADTSVFSLPHSGVYRFRYIVGGCHSTLTTPAHVGQLGGFGFGAGDVTFTYMDLNNDGIKNVGDAMALSMVFHSNSTMACSSTVSPYSSTLPLLNMTPASVTVPPLGGYSEPITAIYMLTQQNITDNNVNITVSCDGMAQAGRWFVVSAYGSAPLTIPDSIKFDAFLDYNNNGIKDADEISYYNGTFQYEVNDDGILHEAQTQYGSYVLETNPADSYDISFNLADTSGLYGMAVSSYQNVSVATGSGANLYSFPITVVPHNNMEVRLVPLGAAPRPGFSYYNRIAYTNRGTSAISGTVAFTHDAAVSIASISQLGTVATTNGFTYNFTNLLPNETRNIDVILSVPLLGQIGIGQMLNSTASVSIASPDIDLSNNQNELNQVIIGGYDPNDKTESHGPQIVHSEFSSSDRLTYTIRFENTGTAEAFNIRIEDALDAKLDETSVRTTDASYPYIMQRVGNQLTWHFNGINLPPSVVNSNTGKGFVTFNVKPKPGYAIGDIIPNTADIYFDFNPAIVTNTCETEFVAALGTQDFEATVVSVYPNPVSDFVHIDTDGKPIQSITIKDLLGKTVLSKTVDDARTQFDVSALQSGMYLMKITSEGKSKVFKIVKK